MIRTLATFVKEGKPRIKVITNEGEKDYKLVMGSGPLLEWDLGDITIQKIATGFLDIKKSEGYQSKEIL